MACAFFLVDAFADRAFRGNQAAVFLVDADFPEGLMRGLAAETNCAETAFVVRGGVGLGIRWFTPLREVALCGHATLAAAGRPLRTG